MSLVKWIDIADKYPMRFDADRMLQEIKGLEDSQWLEHYDRTLSRGWKAIPLISLDGKMGDAEAQRPGGFELYKPTPILEKLPYLNEIIDSFKCRKGRVRILKLAPGAGIGVHRDVGLEVANLAFNRVRMHIPMQTNPGVGFFVDDERIQMEVGGLYYVNFSKKHWVRNDGNEVRIHLVLDLEVNDWFEQYFPPMGVMDRLNAFGQRLMLPIFWKTRRWTTVQVTRFWKAYEGSQVQRFRHSLQRVPMTTGKAAFTGRSHGH